MPHFRVYDCRVQAITKLLSNLMVSPQVSKEIAGHISQAVQDRYSIQQYDTKLAALNALEKPPAMPPDRPHDPIRTAELMHPAIQAEIARQVALALRDRDAEYVHADRPPGGRLVVFPAKH